MRVSQDPSSSGKGMADLPALAAELDEDEEFKLAEELASSFSLTHDS